MPISKDHGPHSIFRRTRTDRHQVWDREHPVIWDKTWTQDELGRERCARLERRGLGPGQEGKEQDGVDRAEGKGVGCWLHRVAGPHSAELRDSEQEGDTDWSTSSCPSNSLQGLGNWLWVGTQRVPSWLDWSSPSHIPHLLGPTYVSHRDGPTAGC